MKRQPSPQDVSWFLDLDRRSLLDLNPPYQRRSVWTKKDREYFIDTVLHDYPSPAVFVHKTTDDNGSSTYHIVDGKQRLETIIAFSKGKFRVPQTFGDERLNGKLFADLDSEFKQAFWNYSISVEFLPNVDESFLNNVFERINRNSRKLTDQELRHAKFDGWFITFVEAQGTDEDWTAIGVVTKARSKRMADVQFLSELLMASITSNIRGFDQRDIDDFYAAYEDPDEEALTQSTDEIEARFSATKLTLRRFIELDDRVRPFFKALANIYSLWGVLVVEDLAGQTEVDLVGRYVAFMERVQRFQQDSLLDLGTDADPIESAARRYAANLSGASTDETPRRERHTALLSALTG